MECGGSVEGAVNPPRIFICASVEVARTCCLQFRDDRLWVFIHGGLLFVV